MRDVKKLLVLATMFIALGCVQKPPTPMGFGLVIQNFTTDFTQVYPGDRFTLTLTVMNQGEKTARNIFAKLQYPSTLTGDLGQKTLANLEPGDEDYIEWSANVPETATPGEIYRPLTTLCYKYDTEAYSDMFLADKRWSGTLPTLETRSTSGPIKITFDVSSPIRGDRIASLKVTLAFLADGFVANETSTTIGTKNYVRWLNLTIPRVESGNGKWLINIDDEDDIKSDIQSVDFTCKESSDKSAYLCVANPDALRLINNELTARLYLNVSSSRIGVTGSYEHIARVYAIAEYQHCLQAESAPILVLRE
ncbi:MAG: NEW3 domain-containing protein [Candidatus Freyarchaeota archaeon]